MRMALTMTLSIDHAWTLNIDHGHPYIVNVEVEVEAEVLASIKDAWL